jgi:hypothetical protein
VPARDSGGGRRCQRPSGLVPPQLEQVVGAAQQLPLGVAGTQATAGEPASALLLLELAEDRLDGLLPLGVADLALLAGKPGEQLRRVRDGGEVAIDQ